MAFDNRFDGLNRRVEEIEKDLKKIDRRMAPEDFPFAAIAARHVGTKSESWAKRNAYWFPIATPIVTVAVLVIAFLSGLFNLAFDSRISAKLNEPNGLLSRLQDLSSGLATANGELRAIRQLWAEQIKKTAELRPKDFQKSLPQATDALKAGAALRIPFPPEIKESVRSKLLATDSNAPGYWSAAAAMVTYRSPAPPAGLPNCLDRDPLSSVKDVVSAKPKQPVTLAMGPFVYENCTIEIDSPKANRVYQQTLTMPNNLELRHCNIVYRGGLIMLPSPPPQVRALGLAKLIFIDCWFEISAPPELPDAPGRSLISMVRASMALPPRRCRSAPRAA
jgi:hypothetical protein